MHIKLTLVGVIFLYWDNIFNFKIAFVDSLKFHISLLDYLFVCIYSVSRWHKWTLIYYNWMEKKKIKIKRVMSPIALMKVSISKSQDVRSNFNSQMQIFNLNKKSFWAYLMWITGMLCVNYTPIGNCTYQHCTLFHLFDENK